MRRYFKLKIIIFACLLLLCSLSFYPSFTFARTVRKGAEDSVPKFNLDIDPKSLFPLEKIAEVLRSQGISVNFRIEAKFWEEDYISVSLYSGEIRLANVKLFSTDSLTIKRPDLLYRHEPGRLRKLEEILYNENSSYTEKYILGGPYRTYYNLNWRVDILYFEIDNMLRNQGIGEEFYNLIEAYLKESGFNILAVKGECIDEPEIREFWSKHGFSEGFPVGYTATTPSFDDDTIIEYIYIKKLDED